MASSSRMCPMEPSNLHSNAGCWRQSSFQSPSVGHVRVVEDRATNEEAHVVGEGMFPSGENQNLGVSWSTENNYDGAQGWVVDSVTLVSPGCLSQEMGPAEGDI